MKASDKNLESENIYSDRKDKVRVTILLLLFFCGWRFLITVKLQRDDIINVQMSIKRARSMFFLSGSFLTFQTVVIDS